MSVSLDFNNLLFAFFLFFCLLVEQVYGVTPLNNTNFANAANDWCENTTSAEHIYGEISKWDVSQVTDFGYAFYNCEYEGEDEIDLSQWDVSNATSMRYLFYLVKFNPIVSNWDVSRVRDMGSMFNEAWNFSQDLSGWNVNSVENMNYMFRKAEKFESDLSNWDVSNVRRMSHMFEQAKAFKSDLSKWNVSGVTDFYSMFAGAAKFDSDISTWNVSQGQYFNYMFYGAVNFAQSLCWDNSFLNSSRNVFKCTNCANNNCGELSCTYCEHYPQESAANVPMYFLHFGTAILTIFWCMSMM